MNILKHWEQGNEQLAKDWRLNLLFTCLFLLGLCICIGSCEAREGTASWYSEASCKREGTSGIWTASGARFDEEAMTCAMRTREWDQRWLVTNKANGKTVIVVNNDFGPNKRLYEQGRIIDLSKGAFARIAELREGIINVKVEKYERR